MATKLSIIETATALEWHAPVTGRIFEFAPSEVSESIREKVFNYGVKQILSDAYAGDSSIEQRKKSLETRAAALRDGTWGTRSTLVDGDVFRALVAVAETLAEKYNAPALAEWKDNEKCRDAWRGKKAAERAALGRIPEVRAWIDANAPKDVDVAGLVADLLK